MTILFTAVIQNDDAFLLDCKLASDQIEYLSI